MTPEQVHYWANFKQPEGLPPVTSSARAELFTEMLAMLCKLQYEGEIDADALRSLVAKATGGA